MKKISSYKQLGLKNWKKLTNFLILQTHIYPKKNSFQSLVSRFSQNKRQFIIGHETSLETEKNCKKIKKNSFNFRHFCHISQQKNASYSQNCNQLLPKKLLK